MNESYSTVLIRTTDSKGIVPDIHGTGFLWVSGDKPYVVTCYHVITGVLPNERKPNYSFDKITIFWKNDTNQRIEQFTLDLLKNDKPIWLEHTNSTVDVVVIPIPMDIINGDMSFLDLSTPLDDIYMSNSDIYMLGLKDGNYDETLSYVPYIGTLSESLNKTMNGLVSEYEFPILMTSYPGQSGTLIYQKESDCAHLGILSKSPIVDGEKLPITVAVKIGVLDEILANNK